VEPQQKCSESSRGNVNSVKLESLRNVRQLVMTGSGHTLVSDEPPDVGDGLGPSPHELLLSALAACTSMTMKLYANRKEWPLDAVEIEATQERVRAGDLEGHAPDEDAQVSLIRLNIKASGDIDEEQRERLLAIAGRCPVSRTLEGGPTVIRELVVARG
jgi:putative redox protein